MAALRSPVPVLPRIHRSAWPERRGNNESGAHLNWEDGVGDSPSSPREEHLIDAIIAQPRPPWHGLRRRSPGGRCRASPARHTGPAPRPEGARRGASRPREGAGSGERRRQAHDARDVGPGRWRLHRRRGGAPGGRHRAGPRVRGQGPLHPGYVPAQLPLGPRPPARRRHSARAVLARAWAAGAGPGAAPFTIDLDSTICETYGVAKEGAFTTGTPASGATTRSSRTRRARAMS